jgi:hypothetical protein
MRASLLSCARHVLLAGVLSTTAAAADAPPPLDDLLARAGAQAVALEDRLVTITATEEQEQNLRFDSDSRPSARRKIVSDVVWVPTGDAIVWAFFRDVVSVDGAPVADRTVRLDQLFAQGATAGARLRAAALLEEGARYNLGRRRTVNTPVFGLSVLHPRNRSRFRFERSGRQKKDGAQTAKVRFSERASPAIVRTSKGNDVAAGGMLWIEPATGALVASELHLDVPGLPSEIHVRFRRDDRLEAWLPSEMEEEYGQRGRERVNAKARYSGFRRAGTEVEIVFPRSR